MGLNRYGEINMKINKTDLENYQEMLGENGVFEDISHWDISTPLTLYKEKTYKMYKGYYLKVISKVILNDIEVNQMYRDLYDIKYTHQFVGKGGNTLEITVEKGKESLKENVTMECGREHLLEFLEYQVRDNIDSIYKSKEERNSERYYTYLLEELKMTGTMMRLFSYKLLVNMEDNEVKEWQISIIEDKYQEYKDKTGYDKELLENVNTRIRNKIL